MIEKPKGGNARVLLLVSPGRAESWSGRVRAAGFEPHVAQSAADARRLLGAFEFDAVLFDEEQMAIAERIRRHIERRAPGPQPIALLSSSQGRDVIAAIRAGATDVFHHDIDQAMLRERLVRAADCAAARREEATNARRLRAMCRRLTQAIQQSQSQIDSMTRDVAQLNVDVEARIADAATAAEFRAILSQELDLESLLRTTLQYFLKRTGPTNAAIFLPDPQGDYSLGAYVNYDCDREAANLLLEHVCGRICPHLKNEPAIIRFDDGDDLADFLGQDAAIIRGRDVIAYRCADNGRTLAIMLLFRDRDDSFRDDLPALIEILRPILAAQLASILRIHHRARPQWPREPAEDATESDDEFGFGIAA